MKFKTITMKRLVLGDIHGHWDTLKEIYDRENPDAVIILGDYFDNFHGTDESIGQCFDNILELRNEHIALKSGPFILLMGNHDFHYNHWYEKYSGYRPSMAVANALRLNNNSDLFQFTYIDEINNTIYSHAGVTNTWLRDNLGNKYDSKSYKYINEMNHMAFKFTYKGGCDWYGTSIYSSPIWVRPKALITDSVTNEKGEPMIQIVGHTHSENPMCYDFNGKSCTDIDKINKHPEKVKIYVIDTMPSWYIVEEIDDKTKKLISREIKRNN